MAKGGNQWLEVCRSNLPNLGHRHGVVVSFSSLRMPGPRTALSRVDLGNDVWFHAQSLQWRMAVGAVAIGDETMMVVNSRVAHLSMVVSDHGSHWNGRGQ